MWEEGRARVEVDFTAAALVLTGAGVPVPEAVSAPVAGLHFGLRP